MQAFKRQRSASMVVFVGRQTSPPRIFRLSAKGLGDIWWPKQMPTKGRLASRYHGSAVQAGDPVVVFRSTVFWIR